MRSFFRVGHRRRDLLADALVQQPQVGPHGCRQPGFVRKCPKQVQAVFEMLHREAMSTSMKVTHPA